MLRRQVSWATVLLTILMSRPGAGQDFIPEPDIIYLGAVPSGQRVQIQRGAAPPVGVDLLDSNDAGGDGYVLRVKLVAPVVTPTPLAPDGKAYIGNRATVFINDVPQGQVVLDERGAIYRLDFPNPARTPSPNAVLVPQRLVPAVPTPPSCGQLICSPTTTATQTATATITPTRTITATPTATTTAAIVDGVVTLEGRPAPPHPDWRVPLRVVVQQGGMSSLSAAPSTDENGRFRVEGISPGSYDILVKHAKTLQAKRSVVLVAGPNAVDFGALPAGDANDDNLVNIIDFSILRTTFGLTAGQPGFDSRADFNDNQIVNLLDFSLLRPNFSKLGARSLRRDAAVSVGDTRFTEPGQTPTGTPVRSAELAIVVRDERIVPGQPFTIGIEVRSGGQPVDGASAYIDYDPALLRLIELRPGRDLPTVLQNRSDAAGQVSYAAGAFESFPSGTFELFTLEMEATTESLDTRLSLSTKSPRESDVTFAGHSMLSTTLDAWIDPATAKPEGESHTVPSPTASATPSPSPTVHSKDSIDGVESFAAETQEAVAGSGCAVGSAGGHFEWAWSLFAAAIFARLLRIRRRA